MSKSLNLPNKEDLARIIYNQNPAFQPWDGDKFEYGDSHWGVDDKRELALKQAEEVLKLLSENNK